MAKRKAIPFEDFVFSRVPPQAKDLEEAILGALLFERDVMVRTERFLKAEEVFYVEKHQFIFRAIKTCLEKFGACDVLLVSDELRHIGKIEEVGGVAFISELTMNVASTAHVEYHAAVLYQKYISRELLRMGAQIVNRAYEDTDDVLMTLDEAVQLLDDVKVQIAAMKNVDFKKQVHDTMMQIEAAGKKAALGFPTGLPNLDAITGGRVAGELTLIAARPAMGKTARLIQEAIFMAVDQNVKVGIISMEMTYRQLIVRILSNLTKIDSKLIRNGKLSDSEWRRLIAASGQLSDTNIFINDITNLTITEIRAIIRGWVQIEKVQIVYLDYIGLVKPSNANGKPVDEIAKISRGLKTIAGELDIPVVALAQLNREVEKRPDKHPTMSDLRDSGSLEQDADIVSFLYRPEYYHIRSDEEGNSTEGICEEIIAKNRNGSVGKTSHKYIKETNEFIPAGNIDFGESTSVVISKARDITEPQKDESEPSNYPAVLHTPW